MKIILRSLIFALAVFSAACKKDNTVDAAANQALTTLNTPASFSWQTSREVSLSIGINDTRFQDKLHVVAVYLSDPANGGILLSKGSASIISPFNTKISIPGGTNEVYVIKTSPDGVPITSKVLLTSNQVSVGLSATNNTNSVSLVTEIPVVAEPACGVMLKGTTLNIPANAVACFEATGNANVTISANSGGTLKIDTKGHILRVSYFGHSGLNIIVAKGSVVEFTSGMRLEWNETFVNNGTITFLNDLNIQGTMSNAGTLLVTSTSTFGAGSKIQNTGDFTQTYGGFCYNYGTFINKKTATFLNLAIMDNAVFQNECKVHASYMHSNRTINNYGSFTTDNATLTAPSSINLYNGAVFQSKELVLMAGAITGTGTTSLFKLLSGNLPTDNNSRITGAVQLCAGSVNSALLSNGAVNSCALYVPITACNSVINGTAPVIKADTDGDGIIDDLDDYPADKTKAFKIPSLNYINGGSTVVFEDNWPAKGDYDLNDVVLNSKYLIVTNYNNIVVQVVADFVLKASGADYHNGAGVQFNLPAANAKLVSATGGAYLETKQDSVVVMLFDDSKKEQPNGNTKPDQTSSPVKTYAITFDIVNGPAISAFGSSTFNPFIWNNTPGMGRGYETHMYGKLPTALADKKLFGTKDDLSLNGKYYTTAGNLPWAIELPIANFGYMKEGVDITKGYLKFADWANSGGKSFTDWYTNAEHMNAAAIFSK